MARVLVACEFSGVVREAFSSAGHYALSCDLLPTEIPGNHYQGSVFDILGEKWDLMIAFPPCTYLAASGLHWNSRVPGRQEKTELALEFVAELMAARINCVAIENPVGCISSRIRRPDQYIQPWQFGHYEQKKTGLWLKNLPPLTPTKIVNKPVCGYWANQTPSGQNKLGPGPNRARERSRTYRGIANAMAEQWGAIIRQADK